MIHLGDITKIDGSKITPVDIITFGSPCQNLSVAGNRQGLQGSESGLFMEAVRIIKEMRNATRQLPVCGADDDRRVYPRIAIWENVVGAYSSNSGEDFRCVLEELARIENPEVSIPKPKKWSGAGCIELPHGCITWRTHDAQYFGVPQRRRRISLVVDFRDNPEPQIQFIEQSLSRDIESCEQTRETVTGNVGESVDTAVSFQERAGKPGGVKESLSNETELEPCQPQQTKQSLTDTPPIES
jgi:DNA (cytosine-5)-methyltransferase 1